MQYRETDLNFILRQLGHEGILFWFEHAEDGEALILANQPRMPLLWHDTVLQRYSNLSRPRPL